ncbi:MAG: 5-formyltetrahydrofolate cyclo-ligase [Actinomycetota bacterium]|jgi:5-formyltetrahydrofolate cyclo-ligase
MSDAKRDLRAAMRRIRAAVLDRDARTQRLWDAVVGSLPSSRFNGLNVLAFVGVASEPNTESLLQMLGRLGAVVYVPRVEGEVMVAVRCDRATPLEPGAYGIPSPVGEPTDAQIIDLVIVPGLAFTRDGQRLGQGGGYYDRYLPLLRPDCVTIGVCFEEQIVHAVPGETHDQRVSLVVTDGVQQ